MSNLLYSLSQPGTWVGAIFLSVVAIVLVAVVPRTLKAAVSWAPRRIGRFFKDSWQHLKTVTKAKADPIAAIAYVGRQLALLIMHVSLCLVFVIAIITLQIFDPSWAIKFHLWIVVILSILTLMFGFRGAIVIVMLVAFCELITNPVENPQITLGPRDKPFFQLGPFANDAKNTTAPPPPRSASQSSPPPVVTHEQDDGSSTNVTQQGPKPTDVNEH